MAGTETKTAPATGHQAEAHLADKDVVKAVGTLLLAPRSLKGLQNTAGVYSLVPDYLSDFVSATDDGPGRSANPLNTGTAKLKALELRYYIDIAQSQGDKWYAHRKVTAIVPEAHKALNIKWEIVSPKGLAGFGTFASGKEKLDKKTTADGVCEVTVVVPLASFDRKKLLADREKAEKEAAEKAKKESADAGVTDAGVAVAPTPDPNRPIEIVVRASLGGATNPESTKELRLTVTRNSDVKDLQQIFQPDGKYGKGNHLLVFQPDKKKVEPEADPTAAPPAKPATPPPNLAVVELNHLLNQVVPRHGAVASYKFARYSGAYSVETRMAVDAFVSKFPSVKPPDWPYDLSNVGVYKSLIPYLKNEYDFDWNDNKGWIVDRHLLIGDELAAAKDFAQIDGLYELKVGVVDRLVQQIIERAQQYFDCDVPWLHRPEDDTYKAGPTGIEMVEAVAEHVVIHDDAHNPISKGGKPLAFLRGERRVRVNTSADGLWHEIRLAPGDPTGWVKDDEVSEVLSAKEDPKAAKGKKAPPPTDRDVYDAPGGRQTGTKLKPKQRVAALETQPVTQPDKSIVEWCKIPVRMKNHDIWLKAADVTNKQVVTLKGKVQIYDDDGQPTTDTNKAGKKVLVTETGQHDFMGEELIAPPPPPPPKKGAGSTADGGTPDAGSADAGAADAGPTVASAMDGGSSDAGTKATPPPPPPPVAFYRIDLGGGNDTLVKKSDPGVTLKRLVFPPATKAAMHANAGDATALQDQYGNDITMDKQQPEALYMGRTIDVIAETMVGTDLWVEIHANITTAGWVKKDSLQSDLTDDTTEAENLGDYGSIDHGSPAGNFGVAYSFGCKNTPEEFKRRLLVTSPPDGGKFIRHRIPAGSASPGDILRWDEYSIGQRVGLYERDLHDPEMPRDWAGIDCSGFVQNCTTYATFRPDGPTDRIVPETILADLVGTPSAEVGANGAIGKYAKRKPKDGSAYAREMDFVAGVDGETHFLRGGDILTTKSHIVIVDGTADEIVLLPPSPPPKTPPPAPDPLSPAFLAECKKAVKKRAYLVVNAFGEDKKGAAYTRKTIRMPQSYWAVTLGSGLRSGRIYIWH